jgi:hypothetical protein
MRRAPFVFQMKFSILGGAAAAPKPFALLALLAILLPPFSRRLWKESKVFVLAGGFFLLIALGPYALIAGHPIPLPFLFLYRWVPTLSRFWWPVNAFALVLVCAGAILAQAVAQWRSGARKGKILVPTVLGLCYLLPYYGAQYGGWDFAPTLCLSHPLPPRAVDEDLSLEPRGAVVELPLGGEAAFNSVFLLGQTVHGQKVFNHPAYQIRKLVWPEAQVEYLDANPFLSYWESAENGTRADPPDSRRLAAGLQGLYRSGFRYIVFSPPGAGPAASLLSARLKLRPYKAYPDGVLLYRIEAPQTARRKARATPARAPGGRSA